MYERSDDIFGHLICCEMNTYLYTNVLQTNNNKNK